MPGSPNDLLRAVLSSGRTPSSSGRGSKRGSRKGTPKSQSTVQSRDVSDDELDDTASFASDDTWLIDGDEEPDAGLQEGDDEAELVDNWVDLISTAFDDLSEKRVAIREKALVVIIRIMSRIYVGEELTSSRATYLDSFRRCLRNRKSEKECMLAARAIALWFISFGTEMPEEYAETSELLRSTVLDHKSNNVRVIALGTLGMANFISAVDYRDAAQLIHFIETNILSIKKKSGVAAPPAQLIKQALETYGFLMTVVCDGDLRLAEDMIEKSFGLLMQGLMADNVDVRVAAAQNFGLVHERLSESSEDTEFEFAHQDELVATMEMMRRESSKKHGKRERSVQKAVIRDVLATIQDGHAPQLKLAFKGRAVKFDDWSRILRLHAFRSCLGSGLHVQFAENPLIQDIFGVEFDETTDAFYRAEGRVVVDPNSELAKMRSKDLRKRRDERKGSVLSSAFDDGY